MNTIQKLIVTCVVLCLAVAGSLLLVPDEPETGIYGSYDSRGAIILADNGKGCFFTKQRMSPIIWSYDRWSQMLTISGHFTDSWKVKDSFQLHYVSDTKSFKGDGSEIIGDGAYDFNTSNIPSVFDWVERYEGTPESLGYKEY